MPDWIACVAISPSGAVLAAGFLEPLIGEGKVYADGRGNAVFLMVAGKANRPIGAELRGTGERIWRGLAPGTGRDAGYFWVGARGAPRIVLCESAIDAISCFQAQLRAGNRSENTIDGYMAHLMAALNWAVSIGLMPEAPKFKRPKRRKDGRTMKGRPITREELERMFDKVLGEVGEKATTSWKEYLEGLWLSTRRPTTCAAALASGGRHG